MTFLLYIQLFQLFLFPNVNSRQIGSICNVYGNIYIETENRNRADFTIYINKEDSFSDLKVMLQENQLYADKPGLWYFVKERELADYIVFIEKDKGRARHTIFYTDNEINAGCR